MKYTTILVLALLLFSCDGEQKPASAPTDTDTTAVKTPLTKEEEVYKNICWVGHIDNRIPIFVHYQLQEEIAVGSITYLNTDARKPIRLIGEIGAGLVFLTEYDEAGNITGTLLGKINEQRIEGSWNPPNTGSDESLDLVLERKDTTILSNSIEVDPADVFGTYSYQYGEAGYQGEFSFTKKEGGYAALELISVTQEPARNIADLQIDSLRLSGTSYSYTVPEAENCAIELQFYKDFARIVHPDGMSCMGYFGHNATAAGIFVKVK
ncbi:MAG: hypothetical protein AAF990_15675 [Bacteroidota bacterium]